MTTLDPFMLPTAQVYLLLSSNTPYFVVPAGEAGNVVGRWDGEVDGGSPLLRDLRFESFKTTKERLGPMVRVADEGRVATHLLCYDPHNDKRYASMDAVVRTQAGNVWTLEGNPIEFAYDAEAGKFSIAKHHGCMHVDYEVTAYELADFRTLTPLSDFHRTKGGI
jgi:hypothetical protein